MQCLLPQIMPKRNVFEGVALDLRLYPTKAFSCVDLVNKPTATTMFLISIGV